MTDESIRDILRQLEDKLDIIIENTTKRTRRSVKKDDSIESKVDEILESWKLFFNKPKVKIMSKAHRDPIRARLKEGYEKEDFDKVMEIKQSDEFFQENPRFFLPATLFGVKFAVYLDSDVEVKQQSYRDNFFEGGFK